jgi:predicted MFS family arabinose efflux permease
MAFNLVVAAAGAIVVVNTVNYVRDTLRGTQVDVVWMLAASGGGTLVVALLLPRVLDKLADRTVMTSGAVVLVVGATSAVALSATEIISSAATATVWILIGGGMALIVTPTGRVLRRSVDPDALPEVFAAQFSLSHVAWLLTYPIAGWIGTTSGFTLTWSILAALTAIGSVAAVALWPREAEVDAGTREVGVFAKISLGGALLGDETQSAAGTLAACQCSCVRPV